MVIRMLEDVRQTTIRPVIEATIQPGTLVLTDEYTIYQRLPEWALNTKPSAITTQKTAAEDSWIPFSVCCYVFPRMLSW